MPILYAAAKMCSHCKKEFPATKEFFNKQKARKDGLCPWCKKCIKEYQQSDIRKMASKRNMAKYRSTVHGYLHRLFRRMLYRCTDSNYKGYKNYGGRGIKVCFKSVDEFIDYVIIELRTDPRGLQIDRINNDGNYEPGNIRFVTLQENLMNRRCRKGY